MTNRLQIRKEHEILAEIPLRLEGVEIGRSRHCDVPLHDPDLPQRAWLLHPQGGALWLYDLSGPREPRRPVSGRGWTNLGHGYQVRRERGDEPREEHGTKTLKPPPGLAARWVAWVDGGERPRQVTIDGDPVLVGRAPDADLRLGDPAVSWHHLRLEPAGSSLVIRDLGSRNGLYHGGGKVHRVSVSGPSQLRVGGTELRVRPHPTEPDDRAPIAVSPGMAEAVTKAERYAPLSWPVLVVGETGAGKEAVASLLHRQGRNAKGPLVAINAGCVQEQLVESQLFGHQRGAFTGAHADHKGAFERADGGTLFLDEIGELPLSMQARLLRVLESWEIQRVGAEHVVRVDVQLVCATHRDLPAMVRAGRFRQDLYYRLERLVIQVPPLRQRPEDIRPLAERFLRDIAPHVGARHLSRGALAALKSHRWPGNVRELRNVIDRSVADTSSATLERRDIEQALRRDEGPPLSAVPSAQELRESVERYGTQTAAARAAGMPLSTFRDRLRKERSG